MNCRATYAVIHFPRYDEVPSLVYVFVRRLLGNQPQTNFTGLEYVDAQAHKFVTRWHNARLRRRTHINFE